MKDHKWSFGDNETICVDCNRVIIKERLAIRFVDKEGIFWRHHICGDMTYDEAIKYGALR